MTLVALLASSARAQEEEPPPAAPAAPAATTEGERVPARLLSQVTPEYPPEALPERLSGEVGVIVSVSADGLVTEAVYDAGGPEVFVAPALAAARSLRFEPARRDGVPVPTRVAVRFQFAPPPQVEGPPPEAGPTAGEELVVEAAASVAERETRSVTTVGVEELDRSAGDDLGEAVSNVPGVAVARGSSDSTKPIIRGQVERRLLVLFDGVRHESQKWGLDHATEIDPFAAGEIHVIKGAAGVRYGPDAIGGVVLVDPPRLREEAGVGGKVQVVGASNGMRGVAAARVDGAPASLPGFAWRVEGNYARGASVSTPTYVLGNTGSQEWNAGATLGYTRGNVDVKASYHRFDQKAGVCYCAGSGSLDELQARLEADEPVGSELWDTSYTIDRPYQAVTHDVAFVRSNAYLPRGWVLKGTYAFQSNHRQEYEPTRASTAGAQYDFTLRTHSLDASLDHGDVRLGALGAFSGGLGVTGTFQENVYSGLPLIPNFRSLQAGIYAYERLDAGALTVEAGARYDHLSRTAYLTPSAFERSLARETLDAGDCEAGPDAAECPAAYDAGSVSLGGIWRVLPDRLEARLDLSSATRFPNADELYMNGSAPTFPVYALGDPGLGPETTLGASPTIGLRLDWVHAEASAYLNHIDDYVYFAPELGEGGEPAVDVTIRGAYPRFSFRPIDALYYGADGGVTFAPERLVQVEIQGAVVRAVNADTRVPLVMTPPDRALATIRLQPPRVGPLRDAFAEVSGLYVAKQVHADLATDLAPPPEAYFLLDAAVGADLPLRGRMVTFGLEASNLLNTRYRDYTSLLRYFADEPGFAMRARVGIDF